VQLRSFTLSFDAIDHYIYKNWKSPAISNQIKPKRISMASESIINSHLHRHLKNELSSKSFYCLVEIMVKAYQYTGVNIRRVITNDESMFSPGVEYLCIIRENYIYNISAVLFGKNLLITWWFQKESNSYGEFFYKIPYFNKLLTRPIQIANNSEDDKNIIFMQSFDTLLKEAASILNTQNGINIPDTVEVTYQE